MSIYCSKCGAPNSESAQFCEKCGNRLGTSANNVYQQSVSNNEDKPSIGYNILGFVIPIVGLILYFSWKDRTPNKAKSILTWSAVSFGIGLVYALSNS